MDVRKPSNTEMMPTATHIGFLAGILAKTDGPVVEFGTGYYSTPIIHYTCQDRYVLSIEMNIHWVDYFSSRYKRDNHKYFYTNNQLLSEAFFGVDEYKNAQWNVAFIDHDPPEDRIKCIKKIRDKAKYLIVHDTEVDAISYNWNGIFDTFKYKLHCDLFNDQTTIVSDFEEIGL
jgi:hypothetical protein